MLATLAGGLILASFGGCAYHHEGNALTPLMEAANRGDLPAVQALIAAGANVNETRGVHRVRGMRIEGDNPLAGETALMFAVQGNHVETARVLLDAGARTDVQDTWRQTVWFYLYRVFGVSNGFYRGPDMTRLLMSRASGTISGYEFQNTMSEAKTYRDAESERILSEYWERRSADTCPPPSTIPGSACIQRPPVAIPFPYRDTK